MTKILEHGGDVGGFKVHRSHIVGIMPVGTKVILRKLKRDGNGWSPIGKSITHTLTEDRHFEVIARLVPYKGHFPYEHDRYNWTTALMYPDEVIGQHRQIIYKLPY